MSREEIIQKAGELVAKKYNHFNDIPLKYRFLYQEYKPLNVGIKRKFEEN
jgi:hypothetical protein|tara:strand:- start:566 stop:715 length:150 start_codon:yes stop_codon:yes gene_type:complete